MGDLKDQLQRLKQELAGGAPESRRKPLKVKTPGRSMQSQQPARETQGAQTGMKTKLGVEAQRAASIRLALPRTSVLTRQGEFHEPAEWVVRGKMTQVARLPAGRAKEVFIGFDFGTAYTKVAVGLLDKVFPVDWRGVLKTRSPYLLPTEYSALSDGKCYLGQHPRAALGDVVTELKQAFIGMAPSDPEICRAAVFTGLALQYVRAWVFERHGRKLGESPLRWHLNIGVPSNGFEENNRTAAYRRMACAAWSLSLLDRAEIGYRQASRMLESLGATLPLDLVETDPVPEFVGQLAGYAQSAQRQNGLHALVDVGGGTVDMVTFNIHRVEGDDTFPFFVPRVEPLGTYAMVANRFDEHLAEAARVNVAIDDLMDDEAFARATGVDVSTVAARDAAFSARVTTELSAVLRQTRLKRYRLAPEWREGLRTFVTGGGARMPVYAQAVQRSGLQERVPLNLVALPKHPMIDEFAAPEEEYHRISVACGLATNRLSLGAIVPANEVADDTPGRHLRPAVQRPDRDDIYSR